MTVVLVLVGAGVSSGASSVLATERSRLNDLLADAPPPEVDVVSFGLGAPIAGARTHIELGGGPPAPLDRFLRAIGAEAVQRRLATFPVGRLLNSMGPLDRGRVFWRRVRRDPRAMHLLRNADIVLAADAAGVKTAWLAVRRKWVRAAYYDHRAASISMTGVPGR